MKEKKNKIIILTSVILGILVLTLGITYAFFTFSKIGTKKSEVIAGNIYMSYNETKTLSLTNATPTSTYNESDYFEFTIAGVNDSKNTIYYEIDLNDGEASKTRTTRLLDKFLRFRLVTVDENGNETEIFNEKKYEDITNKKIWVDSIPASTVTKVTLKYRLYMWISDTITVCGGDMEDLNTCDYFVEGDTNNWNDVYASVKVNVSGDFNEKFMTTPEKYFTTKILSVTSGYLNPIIANQELEYGTENEFTRCVDKIIEKQIEIFESIGRELTEEDIQEIRDTSLEICKSEEQLTEGMETIELEFGVSVTDLINEGVLLEDSNSEFGYILNPIIANQEYVVNSTHDNEYAACVKNFTGKSFASGSTAETFCKGIGKIEIENVVPTKNTYDKYNIFKPISNLVKTSTTSYTFDQYISTIATDKEKTILTQKNIIIPTAGSVEIIGYDIAGGTDVIIPEKINNFESKVIGQTAFWENTSLTSIEIPNSVIKIDNAAFYECVNLTSVIIPSSVTTIGKYAFNDCTSLTSIIIPSSVTSISSYAFNNCKSLTSIEIPNSVTTIGNNAFNDCTSLTSIIIPSSVTSISSYAFNNCKSLTSIEIPNSVTTIGGRAFEDCTSLTHIKFIGKDAITIKTMFNYDNWGRIGYYYDKDDNLVS